MFLDPQLVGEIGVGTSVLSGKIGHGDSEIVSHFSDVKICCGHRYPVLAIDHASSAIAIGTTHSIGR